ncbi:FAD-dependent oxidoreductase [Kribbella sp. NPDC048915]|uniref:FAD-dependent oxidoreductase n=1 Tax=Kribbella sp. NPDC048915 TaxID=3155148 RepID=UPI0033F2D04A
MKETPDLYGAFPRLDRDQLAKLARVGERRTTSAGEILQAAGESPEEFIVVLDGTVAVVEELGRPERVVAVHGPLRFLGEIGIVSGRPLFLTAMALEPGQVLAVPLDRLKELVQHDPRLADLVLRAFLIRRSLDCSLGAGFAIIGSRFSADTRRLRDFAARNRLPHHWIDLETDAEADRLLRELGVERNETPVVIWRGEVLRNPENARLAAAVGLRRAAPVESVWDLIIVGAGPAGLAAAVYGASEGLATVVLDAVATGGQAGTASRIENYLGFPAGISGAELADRAELQARRFGAEITVPATAVALEERDGHQVVLLDNETRISGRAVLIASGVRYRQLDLRGLNAFTSASVYYAATEAEANLCRNDPVVVVGGGNSAGQAAVFLAQHAADVLLVVRGNDLGQDMSRYLADRIEQTVGIQVAVHSELREVRGTCAMEEVVVEDLKTGECRTVPAKALFVFIGGIPHVGWLGGAIDLDDRGFALTGSQLAGRKTLETSRRGVFAVGDVRSGSVKRVAAAVGDGAFAIRMVHEHLHPTHSP